MTVTIRRPVLRVTVDGREVLQRLSFRARYDLAQRVPEAEIVVPTVPTWARCYDPNTGSGSVVTVVAGPDEAHAYGRFTGFLTGINYSLYPRAVTLLCRGLLAKAELYEQGDDAGVDMTAEGVGQTDQAQAGAVLDACGLTAAGLGGWGGGRAIAGTGRTLGVASYGVDADGNLTSPFTWARGESALDYLERLDSACYPYRTFEFGPGQIYRGSIHLDNASASLTFEEGLNIFAGARSSDVWLERRNRMAVSGWDDGTGLGPVTYAHPATAPSPARVQTFASPMIEYETEAEATAAGDGLSAEGVAVAMYPDYFRALVRTEWDTPEGDPIYPTMPVRVQGAGGTVDRLGISQVLWVQAVECSISGSGEWTQHVVTLGGKTGTLPTDSPPLPSFALTLDRELIVAGGAEAPLYVVHVEDQSVPMGGAVTAWAWTFTGGTPASASTRRATTAYTDVAGKSISLTVTAADGQQATVTKSLPGPTSALWTRRPLYLASKTVAEAFDGSTWRTDAEDAARDVLVVSNGPIWGAGTSAMRSEDYLATSAPQSTPWADSDVTAAWVETDLSASRVLVGSADGRVALSTDRGATWTQLGNPESSAILRVVINRYSTSQYFALTAHGYYDTVDGGATWSLRNEAPEGYTWYDVAHSWDRGYVVVGDDGAGNPYAVDADGNPQTFTGATAGCYAVAARIKGGYAVLLSDGTTWLSETGSADFTAREPLPAGITALPRSLARDGAIPDLYYIAGGTAGAYKSIDGFGSAGGYYQIRAPGAGNCPADADVRQIGADGLLAVGPVTAVVVVSDDQSKVLSLWNGTDNDDPPAEWYAPGYDDTGWAAATEGAASESITGATDIWDSELQDATEQILVRRVFTVGDGFIAGGSLQITADGLLDVWVNGIHLAGRAAGYASPSTVTVTPDYLSNGSNVLAVWVRGG